MRKRVAVPSVVLIVLAALFAAFPAAPAAAEENGPRRKVLVESDEVGTLAAQWFRNQYTGYCMTILGAGLAPIEAHPCQYTNSYFLWDVRVWNDGTRELRSHHPLYTDACVEAASTGTGATVILNNCDASTWQSWFVDRWNDGTIRFRNQRTGLCLTHYVGDYYTVTQQRCDTSEAQSWY